MKLGHLTLDLPIIQGGMGVGVSLGGLAGAVAKEGAMGVISTANPGFKDPNFWSDPYNCNYKILTEEIQMAKKTAGGKGIVAINAMVAGNDYKGLVETAMKAGVDAVISGAGLPLELPSIGGTENILLAPIVSSGKAATTICKAWKRRHNRTPDFVVLEGSEAGGHLGFKVEELLEGTTKSLSQLLADVLEAVKPYGDIPVFVAGGVYTGEDVLRYIDEGAAGAQIATRFILTEECDAHPNFKQVMLDATEETIQIVKSPVGMPGRAVRTPLIKRLAVEGRIPPKKCMNCLVPCDPKVTPYCITGALIEAVTGNVEDGLFFCGSNAYRTDKIVTVKELLEELTTEWRAR